MKLTRQRAAEVVYMLCVCEHQPCIWASLFWSCSVINTCQESISAHRCKAWQEWGGLVPTCLKYLEERFLSLMYDQPGPSGEQESTKRKGFWTVGQKSSVSCLRMLIGWPCPSLRIWQCVSYTCYNFVQESHSSGAVWESRWLSQAACTNELMVSVDVKQYWTMLRHWSRLVPNMSTNIWGH